MSRVTELIVNGRRLAIDADSDEPLLGILRDDLGLTGCKIGCGEGECGACTVLVNGQAIRSCITAVGTIGERPVRTIEGLDENGQLHPLQQAFLDVDALQCGYCTPGMIMSALGLLIQTPDPDDATIIQGMQGNLCRCGTYPRIVHAIRQAAVDLRAADAPVGTL